MSLIVKMPSSPRRFIRHHRSFSLLSEKLLRVGKYKINCVTVSPKEFRKDGGAVLLLPGFFGSFTPRLQSQMQALASSLQHHNTIVCWDRSAKFVGRNSATNTEVFEESAEISHFLMTNLGFPSYSVLGWNDGGTEALIMASKYADCVDRLVVCGGKSYVTEEERMKCEALKSLSNWPEQMLQPMLERYPTREQLKEAVSGWLNALVEIHQGRGGDICGEHLEKIRCPTLIVHGDRATEEDNGHANHLVERIPTADLHVLHRWRNNLHVDLMDKDFSRIVCDFLLK